MYQKNIYKDITQDKVDKITAFCEEYKKFLSAAKTERLAVNETEKLCRAKGYRKLEEIKKLSAGAKIYFVNKNKNVILYRIGKRPLTDGLRILGAHIDSPRMDLKQNPLYESEEFALMDTHYYGGIKKYQYVTVPLAMHGVICKKDGTVVNVSVGENEDEPVLGISDLLIHLSQKQLTATADKVIEGENLDVTVGSIPLSGEKDEPVKKNILKIFKDKYGAEEEDFVSAELEIVPAGKARDYGLDRSMIASYGHDDRVCAYTSLAAILDSEAGEYAACCVLVDKEEIGSVGATGATSAFFENTVRALLEKEGCKDVFAVNKTLENSMALSSDVNAATDPLYIDVAAKNNSSRFNYGIVLEKYTGARGKSGANDANPEFIAVLRKAFDDAGVYYQSGELGKVDAGGGGTIAFTLAKYNMSVIDAGVAVLNMHSPMEVVSKADVYETYLAYKAFLDIE